MDETLRIIHFLALAAGVGGGVANMIIGIHMRGLPPEGRPHVGPLMGKIGRASFVALILLWITGIWMVADHGGIGKMPGAFWIKIVAVVLLTAVSGYAQVLGARLAREGKPMAMATSARIGQSAGVLSLIAVIFAVVAFG